MRRAGLAAVAAAMALAGCTSPEAERTRGGGPGADVGNRQDQVLLHAGSDPYWETPGLIPGDPPALDAARHAQQGSR